VAIRQIVTVQDDNPVLRQVARPVRRVDRAVRQLMDDMVETMRDAPGVGLAAPQVGLDLRVIVVETPIYPGEPDSPYRLWTVVDPEIIWASPELREDQEACLSIPGLYGDVPRHVEVGIRALDASGRLIELTARDFEARVFQHEIDHLDGLLFTDRVTGLDKLYTLETNELGEMVRVAYVSPVV
jgi:peptide deformylase